MEFWIAIPLINLATVGCYGVTLGNLALRALKL